MTADTISAEVPPGARVKTTERVKPATRGAQALTTLIVVALLDIGLYVFGDHPRQPLGRRARRRHPDRRGGPGHHLPTRSPSTG